MKKLWYSTKDLFDRFNVNPPQDAQLRKFYEEIYEFTEAVLSREHDYEGLYNNPEDATKELCDVLVVGIRILQIMGVTYDEFLDAQSVVADKNDSKTLETHQVVKDQIVRRNQI